MPVHRSDVHGLVGSFGGSGALSSLPGSLGASDFGRAVPLSFRCVTNAAAGILDQPLNHEEVLDTAERVKEQFIGLLKAIIPRIAEAIA